MEVEGSPDSLTSLTDGLTRELLSVLLEESGTAVPVVDLGSITTRSLPALKSYLEGVRHDRAGRKELAIGNFEAAVREDSTFALAFADLARARWALWAGTAEAARRALRRVYALSDRLPERERARVRALHLLTIQDRPLAAADLLRQLTETYPDDPELWYPLGEVLFHSAVPRGWAGANRGFERALELNPRRRKYYAHRAQLAVSYHHDSAKAAERVAEHPGYPGSHLRQHVRLAMEFVFGSPADRRAAFSRLDTVPVATPYTLIFPLQHPVDGEILKRVLRRLKSRGDVPLDAHLWRLPALSLRRGDIGVAVEDLRRLSVEADSATRRLAAALSLGLPLPDSAVRPYLDPSELGDAPSLPRLLTSGIYLVEQGRRGELEQVLERMEETTGDSAEREVLESKREAFLDEPSGYAAWRAGELSQAARSWSESNVAGMAGAIWRGDLHRDVGELHEAEGWYLAAWKHPMTHQRLRRLYQEMGMPEKAAEAYRRFIAAWEDADEELQPRVEEARKRLRQLTGSDAGPDE